MGIWDILTGKKPKVKVNLNEVAAEITRLEGLKESMNIGQVKELMGVLGRRWRNLSDEEFIAEVSAIRERAGK